MRRNLDGVCGGAPRLIEASGNWPAVPGVQPGDRHRASAPVVLGFSVNVLQVRTT